MLIGYARVSTNDQETGLQIDALRNGGVTTIYSEKGSSVGARPQLQAALAALQPGDVLVVWKLDRMARSLKDLLAMLERLRARGCALRSLTEPIDTSSALGEFVLQMLGAVAQFERSLIRERSLAGQIAAHKRGVKLGGKPSDVSPETVAEMRRLYATGEYTYPDIGALFNVHASTAKRRITGRPSKPRMPVLGSLIDC